MKFLLDTNVFREVGKTKPHENVHAWLQTNLGSQRFALRGEGFVHACSRCAGAGNRANVNFTRSRKAQFRRTRTQPAGPALRRTQSVRPIDLDLVAEGGRKLGERRDEPRTGLSATGRSPGRNHRQT
jgi:hypothetical protein